MIAIYASGAGRLMCDVKHRTVMTASSDRHSCPVCGRSASRSRLYLHSGIWARWNCESCGTRLRFDLKTRLMIAALLMLWGGLCLSVGLCFAFFFDLYGWFLTGALVVLYIVGMFLIFRLDRIALAESVHTMRTGENSA